MEKHTYQHLTHTSTAEYPPHKSLLINNIYSFDRYYVFLQTEKKPRCGENGFLPNQGWKQKEPTTINSCARHVLGLE